MVADIDGFAVHNRQRGGGYKMMPCNFGQSGAGGSGCGSTGRWRQAVARGTASDDLRGVVAACIGRTLAACGMVQLCAENASPMKKHAATTRKMIASRQNPAERRRVFGRFDRAASGGAPDGGSFCCVCRARLRASLIRLMRGCSPSSSRMARPTMPISDPVAVFDKSGEQRLVANGVDEPRNAAGCNEKRARTRAA